MRNEPGVIVQDQIPFAPETVEDGKETSVPFVNPGANEFDNRGVMTRLASSAEPMAEHKPQRCLEHGFVCLLKAGFLIKRENFAGRGELLVRAHKEAIYLCPVNNVGLELFHVSL